MRNNKCKIAVLWQSMVIDAILVVPFYKPISYKTACIWVCQFSPSVMDVHVRVCPCLVCMCLCVRVCVCVCVCVSECVYKNIIFLQSLSHAFCHLPLCLHSIDRNKNKTCDPYGEFYWLKLVCCRLITLAILWIFVKFSNFRGLMRAEKSKSSKSPHKLFVSTHNLPLISKIASQ